MSLSSSEMKAADYDPCLRRWPPAAAVRITAGKEEVSMKNETSDQGGGQGRLVGLNKRKAFIQDNAVHAQHEKPEVSGHQHSITGAPQLK